MSMRASELWRAGTWTKSGRAGHIAGRGDPAIMTEERLSAVKWSD